MKKIIFSIIGLSFVVGGIYSYFYYRVGNTGGFVSAYQEYGATWAEIEKSVYSPGSDGNTVRQNLNAILTRVLDESISEKERFSAAVAGADPLAQIRAEIDAMKINGEALEQKTTALRGKTGGVKGIRIRRKSEEIARLAENRLAMVREVEELSYKMNDTVKEIFQGIARDNGKLTDDRIRALNDQVPAAEKDFERLNELYRNLKESKTEIKKAYKEFEATAG
jgi:hypothetical protein